MTDGRNNTYSFNYFTTISQAAKAVSHTSIKDFVEISQHAAIIVAKTPGVSRDLTANIEPVPEEKRTGRKISILFPVRRTSGYEACGRLIWGLMIIKRAL